MYYFFSFPKYLVKESVSMNVLQGIVITRILRNGLMKISQILEKTDAQNFHLALHHCKQLKEKK